jgi:hypothetical protein
MVKKLQRKKPRRAPIVARVPPLLVGVAVRAAPSLELSTVVGMTISYIETLRATENRYTTVGKRPELVGVPRTVADFDQTAITAINGSKAGARGFAGPESDGVGRPRRLRNDDRSKGRDSNEDREHIV